MRVLVGLDKIKSYLKQSADSSEFDTVLEGFINSASTFIIGECRRLITLEELVEYYDGNGFNNLRLNNFPVISAESDIDIRVDADREFADEDKIDDSSIALSQRSGIVELINDTFVEGIKNIRASYLAGFSTYKIKSGKNIIDFKEDGDAISCIISKGEYSAITLSAEIQSKLNDAGSYEYEVTYDKVDQCFVISANNNFELLFESGENKAKSIRETLGYEGLDFAGFDEYTTEFVRPGIPADLEIACIMLVEKMWNDSKPGGARAGIKSSKEGDSYSVVYSTDDVPPFVNTIIGRYRKYA